MTSTPPHPPPAVRLRPRDALVFLFESPDWIRNLLLTTVCILIPLVGQVVAFGYSSAVMESLRGRGGSTGRSGYVSFDFDQLGDYLIRGLRMTAVSLAVALLIVPIYFVFFALFFGTSFLFGAFGTSDSPAAAGLGALGCAFQILGVFGLLLIMLGLFVLALPVFVRSAIEPDLLAAFSPRFVLDFLRRMWKEIALSMAIVIVIAIPLTLVGLLLFFVGVLAVQSYLILVQMHLFAQLADLYEMRGGEAVAPSLGSGPIAPPIVPS